MPDATPSDTTPSATTAALQRRIETTSAAAHFLGQVFMAATGAMLLLGALAFVLAAHEAPLLYLALASLVIGAASMIAAEVVGSRTDDLRLAEILSHASNERRAG